LEGSRAVLAQLAATIDETKSTARGIQGQICVGFVPTCPFHPFVPHIIRSFREALPRVSLVLEECLGNELKEKLHTRKIDVGLLRAAVPNVEGLRVDPLLEEPVLAVLPSVHALAQSENAILLQSLAAEPFILYGAPGSGIYEMIVQGCRAAGFTPYIHQYAPRLTSMINLVATGLGVSLVPASLQRMRMEDVKYLPLEGTQPRSVLNLLSRRGDVSPVVKHFLELTFRSARSFRSENPEAELR
jgi:DNA-binding transcriptional LysR family regulator